MIGGILDSTTKSHQRSPRRYVTSVTAKAAEQTLSVPIFEPLRPTWPTAARWHARRYGGLERGQACTGSPSVNHGPSLLRALQSGDTVKVYKALASMITYAGHTDFTYNDPLPV